MHTFCMRGITSAVAFLKEKDAKLGGVLFYGDIHPNCNVQSVNCTCEN